MFLVENIMSRNVVSVTPSSSLETVSKKMTQQNISCVIVKQGHTLLGIISERDFVKKVVSRGKNTAGLTASSVMSTPLISVSSRESILRAAKKMRVHKLRHLAVVDDGALLGIVTETDMMRGESDCLKSHQLLQNLVLTIFLTILLLFVVVFRLI